MTAPDTLCILVGGLGHNRFQSPFPSVLEAVSKLPNVEAILVNDIGYCGIPQKWPDLWRIITDAKAANPTIKRTIVVCHSMGWGPAAKVCDELPIDFLIAVDPVGTPGVSEGEWPQLANMENPNDTRYTQQPGIFFKADFSFGIAQLNIPNGPAITRLNCSHNEAAHNPEVIAVVLKAVSP